ncbi:MAG TPA: class I SAM-dependent methyltransferase [Gemmataceae bacterium]|nr:class I SAM-dependent methyltransferase [Gemmataceae bacterium]
MPRTGELTYYQHLGDVGRQHALAKPFSDEDCGVYFQRAGALFSLLPPPPARVLECGCGTGWLAYFLARRGYQVVATDVAPDAIRLARDNPVFRDGPTPEFRVADSEALDFEAAFDVVIFFDSLHHAVDESAALRCAYRALRPGGVCVALEPGRGHHRKSAEVEAGFNVTEKDMPPRYVRRLGRGAGFTRCRILPAPQHLAKALYAGRQPGWLGKLLAVGPVRSLVVLGILALRGWYCGITVLHKDP